jgi:hypothetical protein
MTTPDDRLPYRLITGPDDDDFCRRVSEALADGYQLHGPPTLIAAGDRIIAGQALVRPPQAFVDAFPEHLRRMMGYP